VTNALGAVISSSSRGVDISGGLGVVVNSGSILASEGRAVQLQAGGSVTNTSTGTITSQDIGTRAIYIFGGPATIINAGSVNGGVTAAVEVQSTQSSITNSGTINSPSGAGIQLDATSASNTLTTIVNDSGGAIQGAVNALVANGNASVDFTNKGAVIGNIVFGAGDVALHFYTGSSLTGDLTAGTGTNTISLNGSGNGAFSSLIADFQTITKLDDGTWTLSGVVSGATVLNVTQGTLILSAANIYSGGTTINGGTLAAGGVDVFSANSHTVVMSGGTLDLHGFDQTLSNGLENAGTVQLGVPDPTAPGTRLTVAGNYVGAGGALSLNTFLGGDGSPSDLLIINGGSATGSTFVHVTNVGGPGEETTANGIQVVNAIGGATTAPGVFTFANGELRAGAFDYDLFRGGVSGSSPNDWFLRSSFVVPPIPPEPPIPPIPPIPPTPPPDPLPPGVYPIIGPELATYGVVQPLARQLGLSILGTLDDRVGDTYAPDGCAVQPETSSVDLPARKTTLPTRKAAPAPCRLFAPSVWGRFFGQTIDNRYSAFADPRASGNLGGFQGGVDLLRGSLIAGHSERAGLYGAYGDVSAE
jgi:autotransporter-associated beta strand protein